MGGISAIFLMSFLSLIYFMFIAILSFIIIYIVISYTMTSITVMSMRKKDFPRIIRNSTQIKGKGYVRSQR